MIKIHLKQKGFYVKNEEVLTVKVAVWNFIILPWVAVICDENMGKLYS
jgi:hypothetical protein